MIDNLFRNSLPRFVGPLLKIYGWLGLTPNAVTVLGCGLGVLSALLVANGALKLALVFWWIGRLFDGTDGVYARHIGRSSKYGGFLDINCDMLAYGAVVLGLAYLRPDLSLNWSIILFLYSLCISGALALGALEEGTSFNDKRKLRLASGLAEGGETGIFYSICFLFPEYLRSLSIFWAAVLTITVLARFVLARKILFISKEKVEVK